MRRCYSLPTEQGEDIRLSRTSPTHHFIKTGVREPPAFQMVSVFQIPSTHRQGPRFSIRMIIWIFCSDTETGAVTPLGRGAETLTALKILLLSLIADVKQS